ncbi:MAG: bacterial Ig-like domain-containing protein [Treponema sp.]|nr:bacterial Ig-like domain-containing protein [Treponema sp.]
MDVSNVSGYDKDASGTQTLTVTVDGKTATFTVTVTTPGNAVLQSIVATHPPRPCMPWVKTST